MRAEFLPNGEEPGKPEMAHLESGATLYTWAGGPDNEVTQVINSDQPDVFAIAEDFGGARFSSLWLCSSGGAGPTASLLSMTATGENDGRRLRSNADGGHPNSLGRTVEVVGVVLADRAEFAQLYASYFSDEGVVRLRVSSAMKRVTIEHPDWTIEFMEGLQSEIASIDQASTQWTLALLFDLTKDLQTDAQRTRSVEIMQHNLAHHDDWIVLNNTMQVLHGWSLHDPQLADWLTPHLERLTRDPRKSVAARATKLLANSKRT